MTILCPACGTPGVPGTLFCEQCGTSLLDVAPPGGPAAAGPPGRPPDSPAALDSGRTTAGAVPSRLRVLILNTGRLTEWIEEPVIHLGRTDRSANVFPNIDLGIDGGHNAGVSRRHVRVARQADGYYLEDLGSINGTFLNRRRLNPGEPVVLKDGDEVRLGNIVLRLVLGGYPPAP